MESYNYQSSIKFLKKNAIERILVNMIEDIKNGDPAKDRPDIPFLLLVLDEYTAKLISSYVTMSDVLNKGIFSVEKLEINRQKFHNYQAIYFVSPTKSSIDYILRDFEDKSNPQYKRIHLFFSHAIMDSSLSLLANEKLYQRIVTCKELNLSFLCKNKNLFELGVSDFLDIFSAKSDKDKERDKIAILSERLFTVLSVLKEHPFIQYQKSSKFSYELALSLNTKLKDFYNSKEAKSMFNKSRGLMMITDRTLDVCSPLLHDYTYESLLFDLLKPEEFVIKSSEEKSITRKVELDENDEIWNKYKNCHIAEVFEKMSKEASEFCQMIKAKDINKDGKGGDKNYKEFDEMRKVLREAKSLKQKSDTFNFHIESCQTLGSVNI
jgi:syntaxin-binding protein 1